MPRDPYYQIIDGEVMEADSQGRWVRRACNPVTDIINAMAALTDDERNQVMRCFCPYCGCIQDPRAKCRCWD
jgi:hypothetical protein